MHQAAEAICDRTGVEVYKIAKLRKIRGFTA
jgi:hypothetical protein